MLRMILIYKKGVCMVTSLFKLYYELLNMIKSGNNYVNTIFFYMTLVLLFPIALNYQTNLLSLVSIPIICVCFFLVTLITLDNLFNDEVSKGYIFQHHFLSINTMHTRIYIKILLRWVFTSVCICIGTFAACVLFNINLYSYILYIFVIVPILLLLITIGSINVSLLVGYKEKTMLLSLLTIPFYIPVMIIALTILNNITRYIDEKNSIFLIVTITLPIMVLLPILTAIICYLPLKIWKENEL